MRRLIWAGHARRKYGSLLRTVRENSPQGTRPLGHPRWRWEDWSKEDIQRVRPGEGCMLIALGREN